MTAQLNKIMGILLIATALSVNAMLITCLDHSPESIGAEEDGRLHAHSHQHDHHAHEATPDGSESDGSNSECHATGIHSALMHGLGNNCDPCSSLLNHHKPDLKSATKFSQLNEAIDTGPFVPPPKTPPK